MSIVRLPIDVILVIFKYLDVKDLMKIRQELEFAFSDFFAQIHITTVHDPQSQVVSLTFLPARDHCWLVSLTLTSGTGQRSYTLQCWDVSNTPATCVARRVLPVFRGFRINTDPTHVGILALRTSLGIEILGINFSASDPDTAFTTLSVLEDVSEGLHAFSASTLLTKFGEHRLNLRTIENPEFTVELQNPQYTVPKECLDARISCSYAVVVRTVTLELYALSSFRAASGPRIIEPFASHVWQWRVDSIAMAYQPSWPTASRGLEPSLNILVRYASLFPWPVNALHHYVLPSNESYVVTNDIDTNNSPYLSEPVLIRTIASPIRLFARSDMVLGSYGTALWIDSHTEDYFAHAMEGQRLAGTLLSSIEVPDQAAAATDNMVFNVREKDGWVRIAIEEQEGRIAVGTSKAEITISEYV
ncbi:hypothetical protein C8J57DRAFT_1536514 [Mycena rebaudengoi]|nr:hypothetical protein C8J57DRAFT_1536514 [Mycena rebaudengoi]